MSSTRRAGAPTLCASRLPASSDTKTLAGDAVRDCARSMRVVQRLPARVPDRRRYGQAEDRGSCRSRRALRRVLQQAAHCLPAALRAACLEPRAVDRQPARPASGCRAPFRALAAACRSGARCRAGTRPFLCTAESGRPRPRRATPQPGRESRVVRRHLQQLLRAAETRAPRRACSKPRGYTVREPCPRFGTAALLRPHFLAAGMVEQARDEARRTLDALLPYVRAAVSPSSAWSRRACSPVRDEFLTYRFGEDAHLLARNALLFEEFLVREKDARTALAQAQVLAELRALLHGHCHQKAFAAFDGGKKPSWNGFRDRRRGWSNRAAAGWQAHLDYEAKHYDVSMKMAELSLLPAIRAAAPETLIVADGFSCRHQVADGTGRDALHRRQVLELALDSVQ